MTWKRCEGCTRAISTAALTCEYCGRACSSSSPGLPADDSDQAPFAWVVDDPQSGFGTGDTTDDSPQGLPALELNASFPFTEVENEPPGGPFLLDDEAALVTPDAPADGPHVAPAVAAPAARVAVAPAKKSIGPRQLAMLGGALLAASALIFTILSMRSAASPEPSAQAGTPAPVRRPAANRAASGAPASNAPKWSQVTGGRWTGGNKKAVAFELQANNRIHIWTRDVTPLLIVRCQGGQVEPFVYTQSAARMELQDGDHTVRVAFDDGPEVTERWPDSDEHDALFAKDATAFAHQLATAQTLRFGFEPHNAPPASARFDVSGLNELLSASAKPCGWTR